MEKSKQHQRSASTGGGNGRVWTDEEEQFLLQKRREKMPYKHIAAHLDKTDLACRLHYHHLTHGVNRRRKGSIGTSVSPRNSPRMRAASLASTSSSHQGQDDTGSAEPCPIVPAQLDLPRLPASLSSTILPSRSHHQILPFPSQVRLPLQQPSVEAYILPPQHASYISVPRPTYSQFPPQLDLSRLHSVYDAHRSTFWAAIAGDCPVPTSPVSMVNA